VQGIGNQIQNRDAHRITKLSLNDQPVRSAVPELTLRSDKDAIWGRLHGVDPDFVQRFRSHRRIDQGSASRALSEFLENANTAALKAKQKLAKARRAVRVACKQAEAEAILSEARVAHRWVDSPSSVRAGE